MTDFRPISYIQSIANDEVDLQGYYEGDTINDTKLRSLSSAPNTITFKSLHDNIKELITDYWFYKFYMSKITWTEPIV